MAVINRAKFFKVFANLAATPLELTQGRSYRFLYDLHQLNLMYHLDDDPRTISPVGSPNERTFTDEEAQALTDHIVPKLFSAALPDYDDDPHCVCMEIHHHEKYSDTCHNYRTLPRYWFSFDDDSPTTTRYLGFSEPRLWNGWGVPLLSYDTLATLLREGGYTYTTNPEPASFTVSHPDHQPDEEPTIIRGEFVLDRTGTSHIAYPTDALGLCFNVGKCAEDNYEDWEGYL